MSQIQDQMIDHSIFLRTLKIDYDVIYPCLFSSMRKKKKKNVEGIALIGYNKDQVKSHICDYNLGRKERVCVPACVNIIKLVIKI